MNSQRLWATLLVAGSVLAVSGCGSNNDEIQVVTPPLTIGATVPVDLADLENPYTGPTDLSVDFQRGATRAEIEVAVVPTTTTGAFLAKSSSGRSWTWHDVVLDEAAGCYFWLIDGMRLGRYFLLDNDDQVFLREPEVIRIASSTSRLAAVGFAGRVLSSTVGLYPTGTVVFVLPTATTTFNPLEPWNFDPAEATALSVAVRYDNVIEDPVDYSATMLPLDGTFIVVAIKDTNGDLVYSPANDWWGYYEDEGGPGTVIAKQNTGDKDSGYNAGVDITLRRPVAPPTTARPASD